MWTWEKLPKGYRESPFITLDHHLLKERFSELSSYISSDQTENTLQSSEPHEKRRKCSNGSDKTLPQEPIPIVSKQHSKQNKAKKCRYLLDQLRDVTFKVQDTEALASLHECLVSVLEKMDKFKPSDDGLTLEGGIKKSYTKNIQKKSTNIQKVIEKRCKAVLPLRKKKQVHRPSREKG